MDERQQRINDAWAKMLQEKRANPAAESADAVVDTVGTARPWREVIRQIEAEGRPAR
jgi:hypothetical protein